MYFFAFSIFAGRNLSSARTLHSDATREMTGLGPTGVDRLLFGIEISRCHPQLYLHAVRLATLIKPPILIDSNVAIDKEQPVHVVHGVV